MATQVCLTNASRLARRLPGSRLKILLSAYACVPGKGSEPGVGWYVAQQVAKYHDVWVLTQCRHRPAIEHALSRFPNRGLRFVYYDLPPWIRWWRRGPRGVQLHYYFWQLGAYSLARDLHRRVGFDLIQHVTIAKYWMPSLLALLPIPFIWGPVGGGESAPKAFWQTFSIRGKGYELLRNVARWIGEHDPLVQMTARRSALALAKTAETARRLRVLGAKDVREFPGEALSTTEIASIARNVPPNTGQVRFICIGQLLHWKGFHLGLRAFARAGLRDAEYWIVGDGPERQGLQALARGLGVHDSTRFWGWLSREEAFRRLMECHVLVHPSLHDSGSSVCAEAMAAGRPIICLDLGGPAVQVTEAMGFKVRAHDPLQAVHDLSQAMIRLASDPGLRRTMGEVARRRSLEMFCWERKSAQLNEMYEHIISTVSPVR
jgi:glycosyltransferase involved in cell wall biosynthesis